MYLIFQIVIKVSTLAHMLHYIKTISFLVRKEFKRKCQLFYNLNEKEILENNSVYIKTPTSLPDSNFM